MGCNRLSETTSPYLLQHKDNPVHWWPWGAEALAEAKATDKQLSSESASEKGTQRSGNSANAPLCRADDQSPYCYGNAKANAGCVDTEGATAIHTRRETTCGDCDTNVESS